MYRYCHFTLFTSFLLLLFCGCGAKKEAKFPPPFCVPKQIKTEYEEDESIKENNKVVAKIYFDNTQSQMGYFQDKNYKFRSEDSEDPSSKFYRVIVSKAPRIKYKPLFYVLKEQDQENGKFLNWTNIKMEEMTPFKRDFYTTKGSLKDEEHGPIFLIYDKDEQENMIDSNQLTIIVTDLEEQGLNITLLSSRIRAKLKENDDYVAAVIAVKLPFNGDNFRAGSLGQMVHSKIKGIKNLYAIIAGPQESVKTYIEEVEKLLPQEKDGKTNWYLATTVEKWNKPVLNIFKEINIPEPATKKQMVNLLRSGKTVKDSCKECSSYIWNLKDRTNEMSKFLRIQREEESVELEKRLKVRLFEYKKAKKRTTGDSDRWRLNVNFKLPQGCMTEDLDVKIDNYRYLVKEESIEKDGNKKEVRKWKKKGNTLVSEDLTVNKVEMISDSEGQVAVYPTNSEGLKSSVVCFDLLVRIHNKVEIPYWVDEFNNTQPENLKINHDKTPDFRIFIEDLLKGEGCGEYSQGKLIRMPIILFNVPSYEDL